MSASSLSELAYQSALRSIDLQERAVEQLRTRTGTLLAATALTASFLGAETIRHRGGLDTLGLLALIALVVSIGACIYILVPKQGFVFSLSATLMHRALHERAEDMDATFLQVAYQLDRYWNSNQAVIDRLGRYFLVAAIALGVELVLWSAALADILS